MMLKSIAKIINNGRNIAIIGHISPDLDCLGSAFSLYFGLKQLGKKIDLFFDGELKESHKNLFDEKLIKDEFNIDEYDLVIVVDSPHSKRLGKFESVIAHNNIVKIDHHIDDIKDISSKEYIDITSASCSEIVYNLLIELKIQITKKIAEFIYAGLIGDTNCFSNDNVNANCFKIASELMSLNIDCVKINNICFRSMDLKEWDLNKLAYEKAEFYKNYAIIFIPLKELKKLDVTGDGISIFATKLIAINGIKIGCTITEKNLKTYSCSFRSIRGYDVNEVAKKLGGGGHKQASGCLLTGSIKEVKKKIINAIESELIKQGKKND